MNIAKQTPYTTPAFEIKGSAFTMIVLCLKTGDLLSFERQILSHLARTPDFFNHDPVILDLESVTEDAALNLSSFMQILRRHKLVPVGVCNGSPEQNQAAVALGLGLFSGFSADTKPAPRPVAAEKEPPVVEHAPFAPTTKIITKPIRTGQQVYAQGGDLVLLGAVNAGAEVLADGNIHVYAPLRGRALAGVKGDTKARIFCHCMEAELVSVAGCYRVIDENLPGDLHGKPVQIYLNGERLMIDPL